MEAIMPLRLAHWDAPGVSLADAGGLSALLDRRVRAPEVTSSPGWMADYRVYLIGGDGHFIKAILLDCDDDPAAIESAKQFCGEHDIEVWQRDRKIAAFKARWW
jgi:hypothetical protein